MVVIVWEWDWAIHTRLIDQVLESTRVRLRAGIQEQHGVIRVATLKALASANAWSFENLRVSYSPSLAGYRGWTARTTGP